LECASANSAIKRELTEMVLIAPPPQLRGRGFTIMDGPFFSVMPFPAAGLHALPMSATRRMRLRSATRRFAPRQIQRHRHDP
jgi:hypothetical protein